MIIIDPDEINQRLAAFDGGTARVWFYDVSLTRLVVKVQRTGAPTEVGLLGVSCSRISGPFGWTVSALRVSRNERTGLIEDPGAPFVLECASFQLIERAQMPFLRSLEDLADERLPYLATEGT